jgi:hypothetical protein
MVQRSGRILEGRGISSSQAVATASRDKDAEEGALVRFRVGAAIFAVLLGVAIYYSAYSGREQRYGFFAIIGAIVVLFAGFDLRQVPRWQRVAVRLVYFCIGTVLLFLVLLTEGWLGP